MQTRRTLTALRAHPRALLAALALVAASAVATPRPAAAATGATRPAGPALRFEAPPALAGTTRELAAAAPAGFDAARRLVGLDAAGAGLPVTVVLAPEGTRPAAVPAWIDGYALTGEDLVVLLPERVPRYPNGTLAEVLRHELAHVLLARAAGGRDLPRWFHEGVATLASGAWGLDDRSHLMIALLRRPPERIQDLDAWFAAGGRRAGQAYAVATAFVRDLETERPGIVAVAAAGVRRGLTLEQAFRQAGVELDEESARFLRRTTFLWRWLPLITSSTVLWLGVTALALVAIRARRRRDARLRDLWEHEEELARRRAEPPEPSPLRPPVGGGDDLVN